MVVVARNLGAKYMEFANAGTTTKTTAGGYGIRSHRGDLITNP